MNLNLLWNKYKRLFKQEQFVRADKAFKVYKTKGGKRKKKKWYRYTAEQLGRDTKKR